MPTLNHHQRVQMSFRRKMNRTNNRYRLKKEKYIRLRQSLKELSTHGQGRILIIRYLNIILTTAVWFQKVTTSRPRGLILIETMLLKIQGRIQETQKVIRNDKGEKVPENCPDCGSKIGIYISGEPIYRCSNPKCQKKFGVVPFRLKN